MCFLRQKEHSGDEVTQQKAPAGKRTELVQWTHRTWRAKCSERWKIIWQSPNPVHLNTTKELFFEDDDLPSDVLPSCTLPSCGADAARSPPNTAVAVESKVEASVAVDGRDEGAFVVLLKQATTCLSGSTQKFGLEVVVCFRSLLNVF